MLASSYIGILPAIVVLASGMATEPASKAVTDFSEAGARKKWVSVNDNVMGGVSKGGFRITDENTLEFSGNISLENNGGFASVRTKPDSLGLEGYDTIAVRIRGDGRTYHLDLRASTTFGAASYRAPLKTQEDTWQEIRIPIRDFEYSAFGRPIPGAEPISAGDIRSVGFTLFDKKAGPFRLEVARITGEKAESEAAPNSAGPNKSAEAKDIVDTAVAAGKFKTLVQAVKATGLVDALKGKGPLTVLAPTDEAFAKLPKGTVEDLLKPDNRDRLTSILTYHVVPGSIQLAAQSPGTLEGQSLTIQTTGEIEVNGAKIITADIVASNGVIHVIDTVLMPTSKKMTPAQSARAVIELAIERGVPLFNNKQQGACAAVYEVAIESLLKSHVDTLVDKDRTALEKALQKMKTESENPSQQAWTLRRAMDAVYESLAQR